MVSLALNHRLPSRNPPGFATAIAPRNPTVPILSRIMSPRNTIMYLRATRSFSLIPAHSCSNLLIYAQTRSFLLIRYHLLSNTLISAHFSSRARFPLIFGVEGCFIYTDILHHRNAPARLWKIEMRKSNWKTENGQAPCKPERPNSRNSLRLEKKICSIHIISRYYLTFAFLDRLDIVGKLAMVT